MIIDTSIIVALSLGEPITGWIEAIIERSPRPRLRMSWVNVAEVSMVLARSNSRSIDMLEPKLAGLGIEMLDADHDVVRTATEARLRFPINFGDCFAYAHARLRSEPLLTLDADFLKTDLAEVLHPKRRT